MTELVGIDDIRAAARVLENVAITTPVEHSRWLSDALGGQVLLKCENLQRTGSFKIRGAYTRISRLSEEERDRGVVAASAGNHAQGVALAANLLGARSHVYMPAGAPIPKVKATKAYGAEVVLDGPTLTETLAAASAYTERTGAVLVHPFDHVDIVAGQGTCGLEICEQVPEVATVVVPMGGGGLVAGIAVAVRALLPHARIVGVQAAGAASWPDSLAAGHPVLLKGLSTMADGIAVPQPGEVTFELVREYVDDVLTVSEESISRAIVQLLERAKLVVEPAGAVAVAAMLEHPDRIQAPAVGVLSGGNVDPLLLGKLIDHGLTAAGRFLNLRLRMDDQPGALASMLSALAEQGANVLEVAHQRLVSTLGIDEVEVAVQVETRGPDHAATLLEALRDQGYRLQ